ncbi:MAG: hypothetical protein JKY02_07390 [Flavobacteriaceae bacterium]|nr:hypothetical protein [Flavobacteriaceae bacterium]
MKKILFIKTNPIDTPSLRLEREEKNIREVLSRSDSKTEFGLETRGAVTKEDLLTYILGISPNLLHISGHGGKDDALFFEDNEGYKEEISISKFTGLLGNFKEHLHCIFLNACHSLSNVESLENEIPYIIGMKKEIPDDVAISFSKSFYAAYFNGRNIVDSFKIALDMISLTSFDDELIPQLIENNPQNNAQKDSINDEKENPENKNIILVSAEEIQLAKKYRMKKRKGYKTSLITGVAITLGIIAYLLISGNNSTNNIVGSLIPAVLGALPAINMGKHSEGIYLLNSFERKRNRILKALSIISPDDIDKLNDEFYRIISI